MSEDHDLLAIIQTYEDAANRGDIATCLALFTPNGAIETADGSVYRGPSELRAAHEHDITTSTRIELRDCHVDGDAVRCEFRHAGEVERLLGIGPFQLRAE